MKKKGGKILCLGRQNSKCAPGKVSAKSAQKDFKKNIKVSKCSSLIKSFHIKLIITQIPTEKLLNHLPDKAPINTETQIGLFHDKSQST